MPYNPALVAPMREEMTRMGARELTTAADVDTALGDQRGTMLVFVNSVCGCAAGNARPALRLALQHGVKPQRSSRSSRDRTWRRHRVRASISPTTSRAARPWRCCKDGEVVHFVHRHQIEGRTPQSIAADLTAAFDRHFGATV